MCWHRFPCGAPWQCPAPPEAESQGWAHTAQHPQEGHDRQTDPSWSCTLAQPLGTARAALLSGAHPHQDLSLTLEILFPSGLGFHSCLLPPPHQDVAPPAQPPIPKISAAPSSPQESAGVLPAVTPPRFLAALSFPSTSVSPLG